MQKLRYHERPCILVSHFTVIRVPPIFTQNSYTLNSGTVYTNSLVGFLAHIGLENEMFVGSRNTAILESEQKKKISLKT